VVTTIQKKMIIDPPLSEGRLVKPYRLRRNIVRALHPSAKYQSST
jgi:hypothetical protein